MIQKEETIIRPPSKITFLNLRELYEFRHMLWGMVRRDIKIKYSELSLGIFWAVARPLIMLLVFILIKRFSHANMYVTITYSVYVYSGLILWFYFVEATSGASKSVRKDAGLRNRVYYPSLITTIVPVISNLYSLGIAMFPLLAMMIWNRIHPGLNILILPLVLLQCAILILGVGTMFAALGITSKDPERFLGLILYVGLFLSPVIYSPEMLERRIPQYIYSINPMAGTLLAFRSTMFSDFPFPLWQWIFSVIFSFVILIIGVKMYRNAEALFADKL